MWLADFLAKEKGVAGVKDEPKEGEAAAEGAAPAAAAAEAAAPEGNLSTCCVIFICLREGKQCEGQES